MRNFLQSFKSFWIKDFPNLEDQNPKDKEFWETIESDAYRTSTLFLILNHIRSIDPLQLNDQQCRVQLSKIFALSQLLDFKQILMDNKTSDQEIDRNDELPE